MKTKPIGAELAADLFQKIMQQAVRDPSGCLLRTVQVQARDGYAMIETPMREGVRTTLYAHRVVYTHAHGPIEPGLVVDHLCRVRNCVNPDHLEVVTAGTNTLRSMSPSALLARMDRCAKGHEFTRQKDGRRRCMTCRRAYDLARRAAKGARA